MLSPFLGTAQYQKLYDFGSKAGGLSPYAAPITDGTFLYGTASDGGASNNGLIYKMKQDGTGFTNLFDFDGTNGSRPLGSLLYDGTFLYGTTYSGGANSQGVIFKIKPDGSGFTVLRDFVYATGSNPQAGLTTDGTVLYGAVVGGTGGGWGGVFKINKDGTGYNVILPFNGSGNGANPFGTPYYDAGSGSLYGTTQGGFTYPCTIYRIKTDGSGYALVHTFSPSTDGDRPLAALISDGTYLYGTATIGGANSNGTIYKVKLSDNSFTKLLDFGGSLGSVPRSALVLDGSSFLYGTTITDGANNNGTIFKVKTDGAGFVKLFDMLAGSGSPTPEGTLLLQGTTLFGARSGVGSGFVNQYPGGVFRINTDGTAYTSLYDFKIAGNSPVSSTTIEGAYHYGVNFSGGKFNSGVLFKVMADGSNYSEILDFDGTRGQPKGDLLSDGTYLYGFTQSGGVNDEGTIYKVKHDGTGYVKLYDFSSVVSGNGPQEALISDGTYLYGVNANGGAHGNGTIYKIKTDGTGFFVLRHFNFSTDVTDGSSPSGKLYYDGTFLFGTCSYGGTAAGGIIFRIKPDGSSFNKLMDMDNTITPSNLLGGLVSDGTYLYGMGSNGSANGSGGIFRIKPGGSGYATLLDFDGTNGSNPQGTLLYDGSRLYGTTSGGGAPNKGVVFSLKPDGTGFSKLYELTDGYGVAGSLSTDGTWLYSPTQYGGSYSLGTYFKLSKTAFVSINDVQPPKGSEGTYITITGNEFNPVAASNTVKFNGVTAEIISADASTIVAVVPVGATDGPVTVTNGTTGTSANNFKVSTEAEMFDGGIVKNCNVGFVSDDVNDDMIETFLPDTPGAKIKVSFSVFHMHDQFDIYDGLDDTAPLLGSYGLFSPPPTVTATNASGALTFKFTWLDTSSSDWDGQITCVSGGPSITVNTQPSDVNICAGTSTGFNTAATGTTNITYQWQFATSASGPFGNISNGSGYSGTGTSALSVNTLGNFGEGFYRCRITGDLATPVITNIASLTFNTSGCVPVITISTQPSNVSLCNGQTATLTSAANGTTNMMYQWQFATAAAGTYTDLSDGGGYAGTKAASMTINTVGHIGAGFYRCVVSGDLATPVNTNVASVTLKTSGCDPVITAATTLGPIGSTLTINLIPLITTFGNNLDLASLNVVSAPVSGAMADITNGILSVNYSGIPFAGSEQITIRACDAFGNCSTQVMNLTINGDLVVYNAVSANSDGKNDTWQIENISLLDDTKANHVIVFDRWGNSVFEADNYNNTTVVFDGRGKSGGNLPPGTYFYRITFTSGRATLTGFLALRK